MKEISVLKKPTWATYGGAHKSKEHELMFNGILRLCVTTANSSSIQELAGETITIDIDDLKTFVNETSKNMRDVKRYEKLLKETVHTSIEIDLFGVDNTVKKWAYMPVFSKVEMASDRTVNLTFNPELDFNPVVSPKLYVPLSINEVFSLKTHYGQRLHQFCLGEITRESQNKHMEVKTYTTPYYDLETEIRGHLFNTGKKYADYKSFKRSVLKVAEKDVNENSHINISFSEKRINRKVVAISFEVSRTSHEDGQLLLDFEPLSEIQKKTATALLDFGVTPKAKAEDLARRHSIDYVKYAIKSIGQSKTAKNKPAVLVSQIEKEDFFKSYEQYQKRATAAEAQAQNRAELQKYKDALHAQERMFSSFMMTTMFRLDNTEEGAKHYADYLTFLKETGQPWEKIDREYIASGKTFSETVASALYTFLSQRNSDYPTFLAYCRTQNLADPMILETKISVLEPGYKPKYLR